MDFVYSYESHGAFDAAQEWVKTDIETSTGDLTIELVWADDRVPRSIWRIDDGERTPLATVRADDRQRTRLRLQRLNRGQRLLVEWDWRPIEDLGTN